MVPAIPVLASECVALRRKIHAASAAAQYLSRASKHSLLLQQPHTGTPSRSAAK